jgi:GT2 family glycosyltransferase
VDEKLIGPDATTPPASRRVTLCIVNHNGARCLGAALEAAHEAYSFAEILLVDNASSDASLELVRARFPAVNILALDANRGPGAARNAGFRAAACDLILFQDNDVRLQRGCVARLMSMLENQRHALCAAPRVLYAHEPATIQYDSADCHILGLMAPRNADRPSASADSRHTATSSLVTACFLIDRERWPEAELFDEAFEFNLEDHDFGVRANLRGLETWVEPSAVVLHGEGSPDLSYRPGRAIAPRRIFWLVRNRWLVIGKCYALRTLVLLSPVLFLYELVQLGGLASKGWIRQWCRALRSFIRELPRLRRQRAAVQATRSIPDRELLRAGALPFTAAMRAGRFERVTLAVLERIVNGYWRIVRAFI